MSGTVTWILVAAIAGLAVGGGGVFALTSDKSPPAVDAVEPAVVVPNEVVQEQLSDLDIVRTPCSSAYIEKHGDGLCREMFCLAQSNSTVGAAGEGICEAISNLNNTKVVLSACGALEAAARTECFQTFRERK